MKVIAVPGWGFTTGIMARLQVPELETISWTRVLEDKTIVPVKLKQPAVLLGWSLGGFLLLPYITHQAVKKIILLACGGSFSKSRVNPYGADKKKIILMKKQVQHDQQQTLHRFLKTAAFPAEDTRAYRQYIGNFTRAQLTSGLDYLQNFSYNEDISGSENKIMLLQGSKDKVFLKQGAAYFARQHNIQYSEFKHAGHILPCSLNKTITGLLQNIICT
ncbi:MAG TPA: hypothetical protein VKS21_00470 [Spirochaetota bacterium]|nr:hypothetical protein [Spirochaetota bacterium]